MSAILRQATNVGIPGIWDVCYSVTENTLTRGRISDEDVRREIEDTGLGWLIDDDGQIMAFAIGNVQSGNIRALFVLLEAQGMRCGHRLHEVMIDSNTWIRNSWSSLNSRSLLSSVLVETAFLPKHGCTWAKRAFLPNSSLAKNLV